MKNPEATATDVEREQVRGALLAIAARTNGVLNPHDVLDAAQDAAHILHPYFEWDDAVAGAAYRLAQVGALIRRVRLTVVKTDAAARAITVTTTRGYQSRPSMRGRDGGYEAVAAILVDADKRAELLAHVLRELTAYRKRYADLIELQAVWIAVDDVTSDLTTSPDVAPDAGDARPGAAV